MIITRNKPRETMAAGFDALFSNMLNGAAHLKVCRDTSARIFDFTFLNVNRAWEKVIGVRRSRAINRKMSEVFPDFNTDWCRFAEQVLAEKKGVQFHNSSRNRDRWYNVSIYTPQAEEIMLIFDDVTEYKNAQDRMRENEEKFRTFLENSFDMIQVVMPDGTIGYTSPSVKNIMGYDPAMLIGNRFDLIIHPEDQPAVAEALTPSVCKPGKHVTRVCRCRHANGTWRVLAGTATNCLDNRHIRGFLLNIRDITEQRETEEKVRASELKFKGIIEQSGDGIVLIDAQGAVVEYNPTMERISGIQRSKALGRRIWDVQYEFFPKEKRSSHSRKTLKKSYSDLIKSGNSDWLNSVLSVVIQRIDGTRVDLQTVVSPITINGERLYVSFNRDVTDLRKAEKELEEQNRQLEAKNTALREVMERLEYEKKRIGDQVRSNVERLVLPLLGRIRGRGTDDDRKYLDLLEANLREITAGFGNAVSANMNRLTQKETEICDMIKRGLSCKEIGRLLNISHRTAETHRNRIRKKLEIADPTVNLQTYLKNFQNG